MPVSRRLRIESFSPVDLGLPHGNALHLRGLLDALVARHHEVTLRTRRPAAGSPPTAFAVRVVRAPRWRAFEYLFFEAAGGCALLFGCLRRRPDVIHARLDMYTLAPALVSRWLRIPLIVEVNASIPVELRLSGSGAAARVSAACERFTLRAARRILVLDAAHGDELSARAGAPAERIRVLPIATRLPRKSGSSDDVRAEIGAGDATFVIGFAGNLAPIQGVDVLIAAMNELGPGERELWIVGSGTEEAQLRRLAADGNAVIRFLGGRSQEEADRLLTACQVLVAPYRRPDYDLASGGGALSSKILHYLACDRPVLVSDVPAYDWIEQEGLGERFPANDAHALATRLAAWERRWRAEGLTGGGRHWVEREGRTWNHAAASFEQIAEEIVGSAVR